MARLVNAACRHSVLALVLASIAALLAGLYTVRHFAMTTDTVALIAPEVGWRQDESDLNRRFPGIGDVSVVIVDGETPELAEAAAARLTERLATDTARVRTVRRPDGGDFFARNGLLFGSVDEVRAAMAALIEAQPLLGPLAADPSLRGVANALDTVTLGVERGEADFSRIAPAMDNIATTIERVESGKTARFSWLRLFGGGKGALAAPTRRLILIQPVLDYQALTPGGAGTAAVKEAARALGLGPAQGVTVRLTGAVPLADEEFASLAENISLVALIMLAAMLVTLWFATRSVRIVAAIFATIVIGLVITTAIGLAAVGTFNLISVAFIPLFVGLGVDFGIQLSVRFNAERLIEPTPQTALQRAAEALGGPLLLAAAAIFLGFAAFLPTDYIGIAELGIVAGIGMVIALLLSLTLLPALLVIMKPGAPRGDVGFVQLAPADRWLARNRRLVLGSFVVAMIASIASLPLVRFDFNPLHLRNPEGPAMLALAELMRDPLRTPNTISVVTKSAEEADRLAERARTLPEVAQAITVDSFVPAEQDAKLAIIGDAQLLLDLTLNPFDLAPAPSDAETAEALRATAARLLAVATARPGDGSDAARRLAGAFDRLAQAAPDRRAAVAQAIVEPLGIMLDGVRASLLAEPVTRDTLPPEIRGDWLAADGHARVQIFPAGDSGDNAVLAQFVRAVGTIEPHLTGLPVTTQRAASTVAEAFVRAGVIALVLVSLLLFLVLRDVREVAFTLAPVVLSGFLTLGTCVVIGQPINFANIIAFPLLFGVGVAFHIYFVMAWRDGARDLLQSSLARGVLFSALATGTAFGSLWLSSHPGTASMGKVLMLSLAWTLVCALIFEPALLGPPRAQRDQQPGGKAGG